MGRKRKITKYILPAIGLLVLILTTLNLFLTNRLERYLKKELSRRTAEATDGFYNLSFDDLSIGFFRGELKIEGITLTPDPDVFRRWESMDSLPKTYVKAKIGVIDFKGLNLTWRWNYKKLHFNSFEIKDPRIQVFDSYYSGRVVKKARYVDTKSLYEVISPYINVLSVRTLNLENASVSYTVENPVSPIVYALTDVSFHAYSFLLDENSSRSGKLLYCDNFDFVTHQSQTLLSNNDFLLTTDSIRLSTEDSVIYIEKIDLIPQENLWTESNRRPDSYAAALVEKVEVNGIQFTREDAQNYLTARSFDIVSSDIQVFNQIKDMVPATKDPLSEPVKIDADSLVRALSLYDIISPVLHSVAIQAIGIRDAKVEYSQVFKGKKEIYKLNDFDFLAKDFLVDSLSEEKHGLWYSRSFAFEATGIDGMMTARNHHFQVERMALNTETGGLSIENIRLKPISVKSRNDYMSGSIDSISIKGLQYDKGVSAALFKIDRPNLNYYKIPSYRKKEVASKAPVDTRVDIESILNPFFQYLSIKKINLNRAYVTLNDRSTTTPVVYTLKDFNFYATDFLINDHTNRSDGLFFTCDHFGFSFKNFDNYLPGKNYRLSVRKGNFSTGKGILSFEGVQLLPQDSLWKKTPTLYVSLETPLIYVTGLNRLPDKITGTLDLKSFHIVSPELKVMKSDGRMFGTTLKDLTVDRVAWDSLHLAIGAVGLINPVINYQSGHSGDTGMMMGKDKNNNPTYDLYDAMKIVTPDFSLGKLTISKAVFNKDTADLYLEGLHVNVRKRLFELKTIRFDTQDLAFPLDNGFYTLKIGRVNLDNNELNLDGIHLVPAYSKMKFAYRQPQHQDWFDVAVGKLKLEGIDVPAFFSEKTVRIKNVRIENSVLQNFKNKQIPVPRHVVPMVYSALQKAPVKVDVTHLDVRNFSVVYEELAKKGTVPGKLFFTEMNGSFTGFTNIVSRPDQFIRLDANGKLMGKGYFTATWLLPVDSLNDRFLLNARMQDYDLTGLNELIVPLAPAKIESGLLKDFTFHTEASSKKATVDMLFLYRDLKADILKVKDGEEADNKFLSRLVNLVLKHDNPDYPEKGNHKPRHSDLTVERDPYHSTFNYIWQILRPGLIESVGVSRKTQQAAEEVSGFFTRMKNFFHIGKKRKTVENEVFQDDSMDELINP